MALCILPSRRAACSARTPTPRSTGCGHAVASELYLELAGAWGKATGEYHEPGASRPSGTGS